MYKKIRSFIHKVSFYPYYLIEQTSKDFIISCVNWFCSNKQNGIVLDIGSGERVNQQYIKSMPYIALDYPSDPSERGRQTKYPDIWGDGVQLPIKNSKISLVICHICKMFTEFRSCYLNIFLVPPTIWLICNICYLICCFLRGMI